MTIADLSLLDLFKVYDLRFRSVIHSGFDSVHNPLPPEIASLPVLGLFAVDDVLYIYTEVTTK